MKCRLVECVQEFQKSVIQEIFRKYRIVKNSRVCPEFENYMNSKMLERVENLDNTSIYEILEMQNLRSCALQTKKVHLPQPGHGGHTLPEARATTPWKDHPPFKPRPPHGS